MIQERKENAQKRRREKYSTESPKTMVDMIKERAEKEEESTKEKRLIFCRKCVMIK